MNTKHTATWIPGGGWKYRGVVIDERRVSEFRVAYQIGEAKFKSLKAAKAAVDALVDGAAK